MEGEGVSQADKEILIENVVQDIPTYVIPYFLLHANVIRSLYSMVHQFFWRILKVVKIMLESLKGFVQT